MIFFIIFFRLIGRQCAKNLFLKMKWNDTQCREISTGQIIKFCLKMYPLFNRLPQLIKIASQNRAVSLSLPTWIVNFIIDSTYVSINWEYTLLEGYPEICGVLEDLVILTYIALIRKKFIIWKISILTFFFAYFLHIKGLLSNELYLFCLTVWEYFEVPPPYLQLFSLYKANQIGSLSFISIFLELFTSILRLRASIIQTMHLPRVIIIAIRLLGYLLLFVYMLYIRLRWKKIVDPHKRTD